MAYLGPKELIVMQKLRLGTFAAILLMTLSGCGGGCNKDNDNDTAGPDGRPCQTIPPPAGAGYLCPEGYFCHYKEGDDMTNENLYGRCEKMEGYELCMSRMLCDSPDYTPKCESILDTAYCDFYQKSHRCGDCVPPGPFVEAEDDGGIKTPTTTTPTTTTPSTTTQTTTN
jgi:hypothetical protein